MRGTDDAVGAGLTGARDESVYAAVFAAHRGGALRLAYALTGDTDLAEEVVADAFAAMFAPWRAGRVDEPGAYLRRAVVNQVNGRFRRLAVRRRWEARQRVPVPAAASDAGVADREVVHAALLALPPRQRAVVALRFLEDRSEAETAALLGVAMGTVKSQAARGLERLRAALQDHDQEGA